MSAKKKPCKIDQEESADDDNSETSSIDPVEYNEEVQIDFEGRSPTDSDRDGISQLLGRLFLKARINRMEMADLIISQNYVGSVIYQSDYDHGDSDTSDDDMLCESSTIFGITTIINITAKKHLQCVEQLRSFIINRAEKHATDAVLKHIRNVLTDETNHVGFLINERFINIPAKISIPLLENLQKEIVEANKKNMTFKFAYLLMIVKFYRKENKQSKPIVDFYTNQEEEVLCQEAVTSFEFSVESECDSGLDGDWQEDDDTLTPYRKIILLDGKHLQNLIVSVSKFVNE